MDPSIYETYLSGYTGHIPNIQKEEKINRIIHTKFIPGYMGYVPSIYPENKFSESYGKETAKSLAGTIPKGSDVPPYMRYTSTSRETYINQRNVKTQSTAELLGISSRKISYKKPIPIDTINKYWGVDSIKNDEETIKEQSYKRNYEKFWEFLDSNELDYVEPPVEDFPKSNRQYWGVMPSVQEEHPDLKYDPIPGYQGTVRSVVSENIFGLTYKNSLRSAENFLDKIKKDKAEQLYKSSLSLGAFKNFY